MNHKKFAYLAMVLLLVFGSVAVQASEPAQKDASSLYPGVSSEQPKLFYYERTFGETEVAYLADTAHIYNPAGVGVDGNNNLCVAE